jgi:hypothetical protein
MYKVIYKEQVSLELQIDEFDNLEEAQKRQNYLRQRYYNTLILDEAEIDMVAQVLRVNNFRCKDY